MEYKGTGKNLDEDYKQILGYVAPLENPLLLVVSDMERIIIHVRWCFNEPERLKPNKTIQALTEEVAHLMKVCQRIARKIKQELNSNRVGYVVSGYGVPHVHFIVIPTYDGHDITSRHYASLENGQLVFTAENVPLALENDQLSLQKKLSLI